ncbi:MAG: hypothetical protein ABIM30_01215 [candidate division WOR-3 bacterium]
MITKEKLVFDPAVASEGDAVGAYLRAADGTLITRTSVGSKEALDVYVTNAIRITDGTNDLVINPDGSINVDVSVISGAEKAEDSAHTNGDIGQFILAVRQDTLASSVSSDGDYAALKVDALGALWTNVANVVQVTQSAMSSMNVDSVTVNNSAMNLISTPLSGRRKVIIQNVSGNRILFLGHDNTVSASTGIRLSAGASIELEAGPGLDIYAIANGTGCDVRYMELA